jgi:hypothetical protein
MRHGPWFHDASIRRTEEGLDLLPGHPQRDAPNFCGGDRVGCGAEHGAKRKNAEHETVLPLI